MGDRSASNLWCLVRRCCCQNSLWPQVKNAGRGFCSSPSKAYRRTLSTSTSSSTDLLSRMESQGLHPNLKGCNATLEWCAQHGFAERACKLVKEMKAKGIRLTEESYHSAIIACAKGQKPNVAVELFEDMKEKGLQPDLHLCNAMLSLYTAEGSVEKAMQLFEDMKQASSCKPNLHTYHFLLLACANSRRGEQALQLFQEMQEMGVPQEVMAYNLAIGALGNSGMPEEAMRLFKELQRSGKRADAVTYVSLIVAYVSSNQPAGKQPWLLFSQLKEEQLMPAPELYTTVIGAVDLGHPACETFADAVFQDALHSDTWKLWQEKTTVTEEEAAEEEEEEASESTEVVVDVRSFSPSVCKAALRFLKRTHRSKNVKIVVDEVACREGVKPTKLFVLQYLRDLQVAVQTEGDGFIILGSEGQTVN